MAKKAKKQKTPSADKSLEEVLDVLLDELVGNIIESRMISPRSIDKALIDFSFPEAYRRLFKKLLERIKSPKNS